MSEIQKHFTECQAVMEAAQVINIVNVEAFDSRLDQKNDGWAWRPDSRYPQEKSSASEGTSLIEQLSDCDTDDCR